MFFFCPLYIPAPLCIVRRTTSSSILSITKTDSSIEQQMDGECIIMQTFYFVFFLLSLVVGTTSLLLFAHASNTLRTSSAHTPSAKPHLHGMCTQYRCAGQGYVSFSYQYVLEGVFHTLFPHNNYGISTGAVMSVVGELIPVQATQNHSNRGRPNQNPLPLSLIHI